MSTDPKIDELENLLDSDPAQATFAAVADKAAGILEDLAVILRDPKQREPLGGTTLPTSVSRATAFPLPESDSDSYRSLLGLVAQAARVAANLAADCDPNRERLAQAGFLGSAVSLLSHRPVLPVPILRPLVASIMNLTIDRHAACVKAIATHGTLIAIMSLAADIYTPGEWSGDDYEARGSIAGWLWTIADSMVPQDAAPEWSLTVSDVRAFLPSYEGFAPRDPPTDSYDDVDGAQCVNDDLVIVSHAGSVLERFNAADKIDYDGLMKDKDTLVKMFNFVERALLPPWVEFEAEEGDENDEDPPVPGKQQEKLLGVAKGAVERTIVSLLAEAKASEWVWNRIQLWLDNDDRSDLVACALLAYGNKARSDAAATALLNPALLDRVLKLMIPTTPILVQHSLIGLLRNLSIPETNKKVLGDAGVIDNLVSMDPWSETRDVLGSIQGGAVGVIKNLVREIPNATRFMLTSGPAALHALVKRTNDPAIAMEACRVWVNAIRALARASREGDDGKAWTLLCSDSVVADLCGMLSSGEKYPVLLNEGVLALALLVAFGDKAAAVENALLVDPNANAAEPTDGEKARSASRVLASILAPTPARPVGSEVQANTISLLTILPRGEVRTQVLREVAAAREDGRGVADGVELLEQ